MISEQALGGDSGGSTTLDALCGAPLEPARFLPIAIGMAGALEHLHGKKLLHLHLTPRTVLVDPASLAVSILPPPPDLGGDAGVAEDMQPYMSPEQTGRLNLSVDSRSDLYSLGALFYRMLTSLPPFQADNVVEWVHQQVAATPRPPAEVVPDMPRLLSDLVLKLLAKNPEERYQSASGLKADLAACRAQWEAQGAIIPFPLATRDVADQLLLPQSLYGRDRDLTLLLDSLREVVESGRPQLLLIAGYSGIGKTSLARQLFQPVLEAGGYFICGKFDQLRRHIPYATIAEAFRELIRIILGETEEKIAHWRREIGAALGMNGQLMVDLVPQLELIIGKQPPVPELPPSEAKDRFRVFFREFVAVFPRNRRPLVLFLDDLQWADPASLKLLAPLVTDPDTGPLLLVGAYRDNEVDPSHPLLVSLAEMEREETVRTVTLSPLSRAPLGRLLADTFRSSPEDVEQLTLLVQEKTGGNPFFVVQFLKTLCEEGLVTFDSAAGKWRWEITAIRDKGYTENVADLMVAKLQRLPERQAQVLTRAACIGSRFDRPTIAMISGVTIEESRAALADAVREGLVLCTDDTCAFLHDRIQEAAYSLVPEEERPALHLAIGRLLLDRLPAEEIGGQLFAVVNQLNQGLGLIVSHEERARVAQLNLDAAKRAMAATDYLSALQFLKATTVLREGFPAEGSGELAFEVELHTAQCEYLTGAMQQALERLIRLSAPPLDPVAGAAVTSLLIDVHSTQDRCDLAVEAGLSYLAPVARWSAHPGKREVEEEFATLWQRLGSRAIEELLDLPVMSDPVWRGVTDVLAKMLPPALFTDENLFSLVVCRLANLSLEYGNSDGSCLAYLWLGLLLGPHFGEYQGAFRFGRLGVDLAEKRGQDRYKARVCLEYFHVVVPWKSHVAAGPPLVRGALEGARQRGDLPFMVYSGPNLVTALLACGAPLSAVQQEGEQRLEFARKSRFRLLEGIIAGQLGLVRQLRGLTPTLATMNWAQFDEARYERHLEEGPGLALAQSWYWVRKLQGRFLLGEYAEALHASEKMQKVLWTMPSHMEVAEYHFFSALTCCACCAPPCDKEPALLLDAARGHLDKLREWESYAPQNFSGRCALVGGEIARLSGDELEAERLYERAISLSRVNGLVHDEALSYELASGFYRGRGFDTFADAYLCESITRYQRWGAAGKVRQLTTLRHPRCFIGAGAPTVGQVDAITVVGASQAISGEIVLSELIRTLMRMVLENAGAQKGSLVLVRGEELSVAAQASVDGEGIGIALNPGAELSETLPLSIANYVRRSGEKVILDDASEANPFSADPYLREHGAVSVLCLPVMRQAQMVGLLYLENDLLKGAFTVQRVTVLEVLAAQAAISLENAALYDALRESERRYRDLSETLEVRVRDAVEELDQKNRMLIIQGRHAVMGEMLSNIAHQWRQPLNIVGLLVQELQFNEERGVLTAECVADNVEKTMEIIGHMSKTIDDFRNFFRPEKQRVPFRLLEILERALSLLHGLFGTLRIATEVVADGDPIVEGFPNEYSQVLLNILTNAKDAFLSRNVADPTIVITVGREGERSVITITDNAGGIPEEIIDRIFDPYFTTKGPEHGTGVGLFMCKSIIEKNMGGTLSARNTGSGAEFRIEV